MPEFTEQHDHDHQPASAAPEASADRLSALGLASALGNSRVGQVLQSPVVQRAGATSAQQLDESVGRAIEDRRGQGSSLDDSTSADMEDALGQDLSDVRVHTDSQANQLNQSVSARAFTSGSDIFFKPGTYQPQSSQGRELLAHELTHVVQQREGTSGLAPGDVSHPSDSAEQDAAAVGKAVASGSGPSGASQTSGASAGVARDVAAGDELEDPAAAGGVQRDHAEDEPLEEAGG